MSDKPIISICLLDSGAKTYCGRDRPEGEFFAFNRRNSTCDKCNEIHDQEEPDPK